MFNPHGNVTSDGHLIEVGLEVFTNNLEVGKIVEDQERPAGMCCHKDESVEPHKTKAQTFAGELGWLSDHTKGNELVSQGCYCRHDHWFTVETANGTVSMNGERLSTFFRDGDGSRHVAADEISW